MSDDARNLIMRAMPLVGSSPRGFAQELLAEMAIYVGGSPYDWTAHPDVLTRRITLMPKKQQRILERRTA